MRSDGTNVGSVIRLVFVILAILGTFGILLLLTLRIPQGSLIYYGIQVAGIVSLLAMLNRLDSPAMKIGWLLIVFLLPLFGLMLYMIWGRYHLNRREREHFRRAFQAGYAQLSQDEEVLEAFRREYPAYMRNARYLLQAGYPLQRNAETEFLPLGELAFDRMLEDMRAAKRYIFIEFFIVGAGKLWDRVHELLLEKVSQGVEVRLFYDDMGSLFTLPDGFKRTLRREGIQVEVFNPIHRFISRFNLNYRDHQKIVIIDGEIAYTGGINLADEYANLYPKHGHWKDTAVRMRGDVVWTLTVTFIQMWDFVRKEETDNYLYYRAETPPPPPTRGYVQAYAGGPINRSQMPIRGMFQMMVEQARDYLYITTPYVILDDYLVEGLCRAAQAGVDVRVITPAVADHWYVHPVTRSFYGQLIRAGVRVYEYTPGFIHAKAVVSDDCSAILGTVNWDNRSFYLQYENAVWLCGCDTVMDVKRDIEATFAVSREQTLVDLQNRPLTVRLMAAVLRLFAPLM